VTNLSQILFKTDQNPNPAPINALSAHSLPFKKLRKQP